MLREQKTKGELNGVPDVDKTLNISMQQDWVVYSKAYLSRPETVVDYLSRYTHRTALDNRRLLSEESGHVRVAYKDYQQAGKHKVMSLSAEELIRRFMLHVLPKGLQRIRHCGFLSNACRSKKLALIRASLQQSVKADESSAVEIKEIEPHKCPVCNIGKLHSITLYGAKYHRRE